MALRRFNPDKGGYKAGPVPVAGAINSAPVVFEVEFQGTKLGESVHVIGSHEALGSWDVKQAPALTTSKETFPKWLSAAIDLPIDCPVEYKFLVRHEKSHEVRWEQFAGSHQNHKVAAEAGMALTVSSAWGKVDVKQNSVPVPSGTPAARSRAQTQEEQELMATRNSVRAHSDLNAQLCERSLDRRNFSQSLLCAEPDEAFPGEEDTAAESLRQPTPKAPSSPKCVERTLSATGRGVALQHITSFSALTMMAPVEEKTEGREHMIYTSKYKSHNLSVPVVIVTSEISPFSKTGGLGLVAASYSYEFVRKGHKTMAVSPKYRHYDNLTYLAETEVVVNGKNETVKYWHRFESSGSGDQGCDLIFVDHPAIERGGGLYNGDDGREYEDNLFRFTLLSKAALEAPLILKIRGEVYGDKVLFLANDWQAGLIPMYLCSKYRPNGTYTQSRSIYVVHNLGYQGQYPHVQACHFFGIDPKTAKDVVKGDCVNLAQVALICADRVLTVSPNYTKEIQTSQGGFGLENWVRQKADANRLSGILNGIDDCWNPETDHHIAFKYSVRDYVEGKRKNKQALQRELSLNEDADAVLIGFVGRLTWQKGIDVLSSIVHWLMEDTGNGVTGKAQLIMMGNGERAHADELRSAEAHYPRRVCGYVGFDPKVEHQMMAGCDLFLMPSRYEPCGLPQMYSQRYGTLPIVTATGGLVDSVKDISCGDDKATGFHMSHLEGGKMREVVYKAAETYLKSRDLFQRMQKTAMLQDFYWPQAMDAYEEVIDKALFEPAVVR